MTNTRLALADALNRALELAREQTRALDLDFACALNRDPELDLNHALDYALNLNHALDWARELARELARSRGLNRELARELAGALNLNRELGRDLARARPADRELARELASALNLASALKRELEGLPAIVSTAAPSGGQLRVPMPLAGRLTVIATRLLPGAERARYREEFGSELAEIARAGGGRRAQLAYAGRTVLSAAWQLRAELRSPRRRGAVQ